MGSESIYEGPRLAQPDEVANFGTGDGVEKAFMMANIIRSRDADGPIEIKIKDSEVVLTAGQQYRFVSKKQLIKTVQIPAYKCSSRPTVEG